MGNARKKPRRLVQLPWRELNPVLKAQPGLVNKTWLSGDKNNSVGGFYEFDSLENARQLSINHKSRRDCIVLLFRGGR
jgi:putative monooxygenase ydhR